MSRKLSILFLLFLSAIIYLGTATKPALLDDADAAHALVSREMLQRGNWVVMYENGIRYLEKAPLHFWMVAVSYKLFGQGAFQTRLPLALSVIGLVLMVCVFGRHFFGEREGFYGGLVIATSVGMFLFTRVMIPEAIFALEMTACFYLFLRAWIGSINPRLGYWGASACMGLAVLTLGLIGVLFPLGILFFFVLFTRGWSRWREVRLFSSALIFLVIAVPGICSPNTAPGDFSGLTSSTNISSALWEPAIHRTTRLRLCFCGGRCICCGFFPGASSSDTPCVNSPACAPGDATWNPPSKRAFCFSSGLA